MDSVDDLDGVDFKPFFDMVVGVLFILLILIAAQLFFTQFQDRSEIPPQERIEREWREEIAGFLDRLAGQLRQRGLEVRIDRANGALAMELGRFLTAGDDGSPRVVADPARALGQALSDSLGCVSADPRKTGECPASRLLRLARAELDLRAGPPPERAGLPQARYGRLLESVFEATLLREIPELLRASGSDGDIALHFASGVGATAAGTTPGGGVGGDLVLKFNFVPPGTAPAQPP